MNNPTRRKPAYDPQELEPLLISRQPAGDVDGMTALFEPDAVIDRGDGVRTRAVQNLALRANGS